MSSTAKLQIEPGSWQETVHEIYIGFVVGVMHNWYFIDKFGREKIAMPLATLFGYGHLFNAIEGPEREKTLKVVGVGYGRTGTVGCCCLLFAAPDALNGNWGICTSSWHGLRFSLRQKR